MRFPAGSGWSAQALLDQRAGLDTSALVRGKVAVGVRKLSGRTVAARRDLLRVVGPLVSGFCVDSTGTPYTEARCHRLRCRLRPEEVITLLCGTSFLGFVTAKSSAELDRAALCAPQLLLDLVVAGIRLVWVLPPLEVDQVRQDGVGVEVKVDGVVVTGLDETESS